MRPTSCEILRCSHVYFLVELGSNINAAGNLQPQASCGLYAYAMCMVSWGEPQHAMLLLQSWQKCAGVSGS